MSKKIGIIGVGRMGFAMAQNLIAAGYTVTGYRRSAAAANAVAIFVLMIPHLFSANAKLCPHCDFRNGGVSCLWSYFRPFRCINYGTTGKTDHPRRKLSLPEPLQPVI